MAVSRLTVIIPAYNEAACVGDTVRSLRTGTVVPDEILVVDDGSTDDTAEVARAAGARVVRPVRGTGSKAGAQTFALNFVTTPLVMAVDADTTLAPDAIEKLLPSFDDPAVAAACGAVYPRHVQTLWERARYVEYLFAFTFYKRVQDAFRRPLISSGCFSMYRTEALRSVGGWSDRTLAEDVDLTWSLYQAGHAVRFDPTAVCWPIEPHDFSLMRKQLRRWSHGFVQNVRRHWRGVLGVPYLRSAVAVALWDATISAAIYLFLLPLLAIWLQSPWLLLGYLIDAPAIAVPVLAGAMPRGETARACASLPAFFVLRTVNAWYFLRAVTEEWVLGRPFHIYEKGH